MFLLKNLALLKDFNDEDIDYKVQDRRSWHDIKHKIILDTYKLNELENKRSRDDYKIY